MRQTTFLRTPIRAEHQGRLLNLQVAEQPLAGDPSPTDIYPQTLLITFRVAPGTTEVQIAPLWEGSFKFLADSTAGYPTDPSQVTDANFPQWNLVGDLVLETGLPDIIDLKSAFASQISLISPPPSIVRYSKVRLTRDFLFVTIAGLQDVCLISGGQPVDNTDPLWREKLIIAFLHGQANLYCELHDSDPTQDFALKPMPSVSLQPAGSDTRLKVTIASRAAELANETNWFAPQHEIDDIFADPLADPAFNTRPDWKFDAGHPSHSVISPFALFSSALTTAYASDHGPATPLRVALTAPRADGKKYRRIELLRSTAPPVLGSVSSYPQRPFPMHQLSWQLLEDQAGLVESVRIPLSGRIYVPLANGQHGFFANPRFRPNPEVDADALLTLSTETLADKFLSMPRAAVTLTVGAEDRAVRLYANLLEYDGTRAWVVLRDNDSKRLAAKAAAEKRWNVDVLNLFIRRVSGMAQYSPIYGHIRAAAMRHYLAPEYLHAVVMGEGLGGNTGLLQRIAETVPIPPYKPTEDTKQIDSVRELGLDWIADDLSGSPIPVENRDIGLQELIEKHFVDSTQFDPFVLTNIRTFRTEAHITHWTGDPKGWLTAIELVAAETQARLEMMFHFLENEGRFIANITETQRRFLAYARYNTERNLDTWPQIALQLDRRCSRWVGARPSNPNDTTFTAIQRVTYNSLQHLPVAEWYEQVGVYS
jgi:hypothetical protein